MKKKKSNDVVSCEFDEFSVDPILIVASCVLHRLIVMAPSTRRLG